jgi:hypothetical protein
MTGWVVGAGSAYNPEPESVIQPTNVTRPSTSNDIIDKAERSVLATDESDLDSEPEEAGNGLQGIGFTIQDSLNLVDGNMPPDFQFVKRPSDSVGSFETVGINSLSRRNAVSGKWSDESG